MANTPNQTQSSKKYDKNEFSITGRLTKEPEVRNSSSGQYGMFTIANNRGDNTNFFTFFVKENQIPFLIGYFHKGSLVDVTGTIVPSVETLPDGNKRTSMKLIVSRMGLLGVSNPSSSTPVANNTFANNQTVATPPVMAPQQNNYQAPQQMNPGQPMGQPQQNVQQAIPQMPTPGGYYQNPAQPMGGYNNTMDDDDLPF